MTVVASVVTCPGPSLRRPTGTPRFIISPRRPTGARLAHFFQHGLVYRTLRGQNRGVDEALACDGHISSSYLHHDRRDSNLEERPAERGCFSRRSSMDESPVLRLRRVHECKSRSAGDNGQKIEYAFRHHAYVLPNSHDHHEMMGHVLFILVVLTTIWCELFAEPRLFSRRRVNVRDHKILGASCIFLGGFVGRALADSIGAAGALGVGTGIRVVIALGWLFVPSKCSPMKC
jgi:hypothetical protein